jgi:hypothetical protein
MEQIHTLAGGSRAQIRQLNSLNAQTAGALAGAGNIAGSQLYNSAIARTRNNEDLASGSRRSSVRPYMRRRRTSAS